MRSLLLILVLAVGLSLTACGPGVSEEATGEEIYSLSCARCHGSDLSGTGSFPALGAGSAAAEKDDPALLQTISRGRGSMPSFESQLSSEQIDRVLAFIREQQNG